MKESGVKTVLLSENELAYFYEHLGDNSKFQCKVNQYLIPTIEKFVGNKAETEIEQLAPYYWNGEQFIEVPYITLDSHQFGRIKPRDSYQKCYFDSLTRNQLTFCTGGAGSGKSLAALGYLFQELQKGRIDRIIVFCNPEPAHSAAKLGFYPGTREEKLLDTSIGSILTSKLGSRYGVMQLLEKEQLIMLPMVDARGYEVPPKSGVYFTEAQNLTRYLMQLFLQRCAEDSKVIVEGDFKQADSFVGEADSGLLEAIRVFLGEDYAAHTPLKAVYRSRIANKAEEMNTK